MAMGVPTFGLAKKGIGAIGDVLSGSSDEEDITAIEKFGDEAKKRSRALLTPEKQRTPPKEIAAFRSEFEDVLTGLGKTLVVFVDNLDRCLPKQTIHTLEALRLFLFMGHTAFVVAADEEMVRHSVSEYFKDPGDRHVTDYLDKLIQVPVRVPRLGTQEVRAYLFLLFASAGGVGVDKVEGLRAGLELNLRKAWKDEPISTEAALAMLGQSPPDEVALGFGIADRMAPMLANSTLVQGNPRIVKRMLNVVRMRARVAKLREMRIDETLIAKLVLFERCTDAKAVSHLYSEINAAASGKPEIIVALEHLLDDPEKFRAQCPEPWAAKADFLREWLSLEPPLAGTDLRPLVYLSRETTPLRALRGGLSASAAEALQILLRAPNTSSPSGKSAIGSIPDGEHPSVMGGLIQTFRTHTDWSTKPKGFDGALMLADRSLDAGSLLSGFIHTVMPTKLRPWLNVLVKNSSWHKDKENR
jgi:predicted KAP-like P-loop ATPase